MGTKTLRSDMPAQMNTQSGEGRLIITIKMEDDAVLTEEEKAVMKRETAPDEKVVGAGRLTIEAEIEVGDLKTQDIVNCEPDQYLENGIIAGILDAVRHGLADRRGINFEDAVENAREKAESAHTVCRQIKLVESLANKLQLACGEAEGEC
jgi:hypothetical protein